MGSGRFAGQAPQLVWQHFVILGSGEVEVSLLERLKVAYSGPLWTPFIMTSMGWGKHRGGNPPNTGTACLVRVANWY